MRPCWPRRSTASRCSSPTDSGARGGSAGAKLRDWLPACGEPLIRTFLDAGRIQNFLFFVVLFIHITIPILLGVAYWMHVMRLSRARFMPPRVVLWVTGAALVIASVLRPGLSGPPAA